MAVLRRLVTSGAFVDAGIAVVNCALVVVLVTVAEDPGARPRDAVAYLLAALMIVPQFARHRWPLAALLLVSLFLFTYYSVGYPGIAPSLVLAVAVYAAVLAGRLYWAIAINIVFFGAGFFVVAFADGQGVLPTIADFAPQVAIIAAVILLAEVVVSRRELAAEARDRLRRAEEEREREAARRVAEERLRIARELHDTVAHSMATITVQAGSALHVLGRGDDTVRTALTAIRTTSKQTLREMRATLGMLRGGAGEPPPAEPGLDLLPALVETVKAAGVPVELRISGTARPLAAPVDRSAYRIVQESLTNVLRHAGPRVRATVQVSYEPDGVALRVSDDGRGSPDPAEPAAAGNGAGGAGGGHGLGGMRERAEALGGTFRAAPGPDGGFVVSARLPAARPAVTTE